MTDHGLQSTCTGSWDFSGENIEFCKNDQMCSKSFETCSDIWKNSTSNYEFNTSEILVKQ